MGSPVTSASWAPTTGHRPREEEQPFAVTDDGTAALPCLAGPAPPHPGPAALRRARGPRSASVALSGLLPTVPRVPAFVPSLPLSGTSSALAPDGAAAPASPVGEPPSLSVLSVC